MSPLNCPYSISIKENMTTSTPTQVKQEIKDRVAGWVQTYADTITENYFQYHVRTLKGNLSGNYPEYAKEQLDAIENGTANLMKFKVKSGKKYYKIVQQEFETWEKSKYYGQYRDGSVHAFVNKETGEVFKPASWAAPAKHVRFDLRIIRDREFLFNSNNTGWAGGYLYIR
mgnify:FL=1